mmetsp:Transcript_22214/g.33849  ORF Transcript_22214/g.33849 Transcript_22214/m.33849 type:complete len:228 (-) Transcript_22214:335-1018(-)
MRPISFPRKLHRVVNGKPCIQTANTNCHNFTGKTASPKFLICSGRKLNLQINATRTGVLTMESCTNSIYSLPSNLDSTTSLRTYRPSKKAIVAPDTFPMALAMNPFFNPNAIPAAVSTGVVTPTVTSHSMNANVYMTNPLVPLLAKVSKLEANFPLKSKDAMASRLQTPVATRLESMTAINILFLFALDFDNPFSLSTLFAPPRTITLPLGVLSCMLADPNEKRLGF